MSLWMYYDSFNYTNYTNYTLRLEPSRTSLVFLPMYLGIGSTALHSTLISPQPSFTSILTSVALKYIKQDISAEEARSSFDNAISMYRNNNLPF